MAIEIQQQKKPTQARVQKEIFRKRWITLFNKANAIRHSEVDVYIVLRRHGYFYTFNNKGSLEWLPTKKDLVGKKKNLLKISLTHLFFFF